MIKCACLSEWRDQAKCKERDINWRVTTIYLYLKAGAFSRRRPGGSSSIEIIGLENSLLCQNLTKQIFLKCEIKCFKHSFFQWLEIRGR